MSPDDIRRRGLKALRERLGRADTIRFIQQLDPGRGDYTQDRRDWVDHTSLEDLQTLAARTRTKRRKRTK